MRTKGREEVVHGLVVVEGVVHCQDGLVDEKVVDACFEAKRKRLSGTADLPFNLDDVGKGACHVCFAGFEQLECLLLAIKRYK